MRVTSTLNKSFKSKESFKKTLITTAVAAAVAMSSGFASAASDQPTLTEPVNAGNWSASLNRTEGGNYDINVFDQLITGTGDKTLNVEKSFEQTDFDAVKKLDGFGEFGNYYEDELHNPYEVGMVDGVFINGADTDVTFNNASVVVTGGTLEKNPYVEIGGVYHRDGVARFAGASTMISASTAAAADSNGESWVYGYAVENPLGFAETQREVAFSADKTDISAASTNENGLDAIALLVSTDAVDNPAVSFARGESTVTASTAANDKIAVALFLHNSDGNTGTSGTVTLDEGATLNLVANGGFARGLHADHGTFTSNGTLNIRATSEAENARVYGIFASDDARLAFNGNTEVYAQGDEAHALFVGANDMGGDHYVQTYHPSVTFSEGSTTSLNGAVLVEAGNTVTLDGKMAVTGDFDLAGSLTGKGDLTINGQRAEYGDVMEGVIFRENANLSVGNLSISNADFTNTSNIDVTGSITLNNVKIDNLDDGDVEAKDAIYLGAGTVLRNYGHFDADNWVLLEGSKYLEAYDEGDPEFSNGNMVHDSGRVEFAGGLYGLVSDENALKSWTLTTDREEAAEWGDDYTQPQLVISASEYDWDYVTVDSTATETNALEVTGGALKLGAFNAQLGRAAVAGGEFHADTLNSSGAFTINVGANGTFTVGSFVGAEGGAFTLASGTMQADTLNLTNGLLTIAAGATLSTLSNQVFDPGLNEAGTNPDAGRLVYGEDHLLFADGSTLTLRDQFYSDDFAASAGALLDGVHITFTGTPVNSEGEIVTEKPIEDIPENTTQSTVTITAEADDSGTVSVDKTIGGKDLIVDDKTTNVAISGDKTLTLVGSAEGGELVKFGTKDNTQVSVNGGLALGSADSSSLTRGTITSSVKLSQGASLSTTNGEFTLANVVSEGADIAVGTGSLNIGELTVSGDSSLKGTLDADTVTGEGKLLVGSAQEEASASATLNVGTLEHTGVIFIDPAWTDGATMADGSFLTVQQLGTDGELKADIVAGQHSTFVFGATKDDAVQAFAKTGLTYGQKDVSAVLYLAKPVSVTEGSVTVDGSMAELGNNFAPVAGSVTIAKNGLAMIDAKALTDGAAITANTVTFNEGSHIRVVNLTKNSEGILVDADTLNISDDVIEDAKSTSAIVSLDLTKNDDGTLGYTTTINDAAIVFEGFEGASLMNAMHQAGRNDVEAADRATRFLSRMAAYGDYGVETAEKATDIGNQAMALAATAGVYNVALDASKLMNRSVDGRMSIANGLVRGEGTTVWADVLATRTEAESLYGDAGYDVDLYGGVLGMDVGLGNGKVIGAALTVGTGDGGSNGAAFDIDNDADFVGFSVYGSHRLGDFNGKVDIGWMHTTNDLSATAFGMKLDDEVKADAWTVGIGGEYLFKAGSVNIVPHVGIRWTRLDVDGYTGAFKTDDDTMDVFTAPIGVAFSGNMDAGGWKLAPKVDLSIVPSFGDDEATSKVRWGSVKETIKTQVVDDAPFQASLGIDAQNGDWTVGAAYELGIGGDDRLDNYFSLRARYAF